MHKELEEKINSACKYIKTLSDSEKIELAKTNYLNLPNAHSQSRLFGLMLIFPETILGIQAKGPIQPIISAPSSPVQTLRSVSVV